MLYTYTNRHAGTPDKNKNKTIVKHDESSFIIILQSTLIHLGRIV